jgi:Xylanase inhibitor N-terminal
MFHHPGRKNQWSSFLTILLVLLFAAAVAFTRAVDVLQRPYDTSIYGGAHDNGDGIITMPLVPHREQKARRRLEKGDGNSNNNDTTDDRKRQQQQQQEELRSHYRRRELQENNNADVANFHPQQIAPLYQGYGTHYADLWCGTPPQRQTVIVDTGSGVTAFPCSGCGSDCGVPKYHASPLFVEDDSSSFTKLTCEQCLRGTCRKYGEEECHIGMSYQEGSSWSAYEAVDKCFVGGPHVTPAKDDGGVDAMDPMHAAAFSFDMKFGCQTHLTGLFITQVRTMPFFYSVFF